jgi:hypothetical protein
MNVFATSEDRADIMNRIDEFATAQGVGAGVCRECSEVTSSWDRSPDRLGVRCAR